MRAARECSAIRDSTSRHTTSPSRTIAQVSMFSSQPSPGRPFAINPSIAGSIDATGVQGDDPVDAGDRREAVGDDEAGAVGHEGFQTGLHPPLGLGVQG